MVRYMGNSTVAKEASTERLLVELEAMEFVLQHTSIPIPRPHRIVPSKTEGMSYLIMDQIEGETLIRAWRTLTRVQKEIVVRQLGQYVQQLRRLPPINTISSPLGGHFYDMHFGAAIPAEIGPFQEEREFNDWRIGRFDILTWQPKTAARLASIRKSMKEDHKIVFTHGDLARRNILIRRIGDDDITITAVLDWEQAGWRPDYWEALKFVDGDGICRDWMELGQREPFMQGYDVDLQREETLRDMSGAPM